MDSSEISLALSLSGTLNRVTIVIWGSHPETKMGHVKPIQCSSSLKFKG